MIKEVVEKTISKLGASPIESGNYPVIIENEAMRSLLSCFMSNFSGEAAINKVTPYLDKVGKQIFSEKITILDMPLQEDAIMREPFDDEGVACYNKTIVENGKFLGFMHNLKTAKYFNTKSTGNGFGNSIMGMNFQIKEGNKSKDELIKSIDKSFKNPSTRFFIR